MLYTGVTAKIEVGANKEVAHISEFSIDISAEILEAPSLGSEWKEKVAGQKDWTASSNGSLDLDTASNQKAVIDGLIAGTVLPVTFYVTDTLKFAGDALVESISISDAADGKADIDISLSGTGALTPSYPVA